jgi:hypothetical protein
MATAGTKSLGHPWDPDDSANMGNWVAAYVEFHSLLVTEKLPAERFGRRWLRAQRKPRRIQTGKHQNVSRRSRSGGWTRARNVCFVVARLRVGVWCDPGPLSRRAFWGTVRCTCAQLARPRRLPRIEMRT